MKVKTQVAKNKEKKGSKSIYTTPSKWQAFDLACEANGKKPTQVLEDFMEQYVKDNYEPIQQLVYKKALIDMVQNTEINEEMFEKFKILSKEDYLKYLKQVEEAMKDLDK